MVLAYIVLIPLFFVLVWVFFRFSPRAARPGDVVLYNAATVLVAIICSGGYTTWLYAAMSKGSDSGWWPVIAFLASLVISTGVLWISALLRNFVIFGNRSA